MFEHQITFFLLWTNKMKGLFVKSASQSDFVPLLTSTRQYPLYTLFFNPQKQYGSSTRPFLSPLVGVQDLQLLIKTDDHTLVIHWSLDDQNKILTSPYKGLLRQISFLDDKFILSLQDLHHFKSKPTSCLGHDVTILFLKERLSHRSVTDQQK